MKDYYHILQISPDASQAEVKKAYRRLAKVYHPDVAVAVENRGEAVFIHEINEAYKTLSNPAKRSHYDWIRTNRNNAVVEEEPLKQPFGQAQTFYRRSPSEEEIVRPYLKYTYTVSRIALVFALLLAIDFFLPLQQRSDKATYVIKVFSSHRGNEYHDHTELQTWSGRKVSVSKEAGDFFEQNPHLFLYSTPVLGKTRYVAPVDRLESGFSIGRSIYGNFIFFPLILLICAFLGSIKRFSAPMDFSFGIASGLLLIISAVLLLI